MQWNDQFRMTKREVKVIPSAVEGSRKATLDVTPLDSSTPLRSARNDEPFGLEARLRLLRRLGEDFLEARVVPSGAVASRAAFYRTGRGTQAIPGFRSAQNFFVRLM